jgi:hypothetical protein
MWAKPARSYQAFFDSIILNSCINNFKILVKAVLVITIQLLMLSKRCFGLCIFFPPQICHICYGNILETLIEWEI